MSSPTTIPGTTWTPGRRIAAGVFGLLIAGALACAALYLSAVLFLILGKVNPTRARFASIVVYWNAYATDPKLRKRLIGSIAASGVGLLVVLPAAALAAGRRRRPCTATPASPTRQRSHGRDCSAPSRSQPRPAS